MKVELKCPYCKGTGVIAALDIDDNCFVCKGRRLVEINKLHRALSVIALPLTADTQPELPDLDEIDADEWELDRKRE